MRSDGTLQKDGSAPKRWAMVANATRPVVDRNQSRKTEVHKVEGFSIGARVRPSRSLKMKWSSTDRGNSGPSFRVKRDATLEGNRLIHVDSVSSSCS
jgi:hypothetical protein